MVVFLCLVKRCLIFIPKKNTMLERNTMKNLTLKKELKAFKHNGFWQCMDTLRDKELLNKVGKKNASYGKFKVI